MSSIQAAAEVLGAAPPRSCVLAEAGTSVGRGMGVGRSAMWARPHAECCWEPWARQSIGRPDWPMDHILATSDIWFEPLSLTPSTRTKALWHLISLFPSYPTLFCNLFVSLVCCRFQRTHIHQQKSYNPLLLNSVLPKSPKVESRCPSSV